MGNDNTMGYLLWEPRTSNKPGAGGFVEGVPTKPRLIRGGEEVFFRELPLWKDPYIHMVPARRRYRQEVLLSMAFRPSAMGSCGFCGPCPATSNQ